METQIMKITAEEQDLIERAQLGECTDEELTKFIISKLISNEDLAYIADNGWTVMDVVYGKTVMSRYTPEAEEQSRRIQSMYDDWNTKLDQRVFGQ